MCKKISGDRVQNEEDGSGKSRGQDKGEVREHYIGLAMCDLARLVSDEEVLKLG